MSAEAVDEGRRGLWLTVLGPVGAWRDGAPLELGPPQQRALLALLLARPGQPMEVEQIVDALWADEPPASARTLVYRYIGLLRRILEPDLGPRESGRRLLRGAGGYRVDADPRTLDVLRFRQLVGEARLARDGGSPQDSAQTYVAALALWQGRVADGVHPLVRIHPILTALDRERHGVVKEAADVALRCGRGGELLAALRRCAVERPLDEPLHARLLGALMSTGRAQEALRAYGAVRARLADELGIGPGPELRTAARQILGTPVVPALAGNGRREDPVTADRTGSSAGSFLVPAQLPPDLPVFVGRQRETALMPSADDLRDQPAVVALNGPPGVGKSAFARRWSRRARSGFPDGQLYADLRGSAHHGPPAEPTAVLGNFLRSLGIPAAEGPDVDRSRRYREALAGRRVLVVLDDARDAAQVADLLPATPGCLAVITSRGPLPELASSAQHTSFLTLEPFSADEARDCVAARIGQDRVTGDEDAVAAITTLTGGLPLAVAAVAARLAGRPAFSLSALAADLRECKLNLNALPELRSAFDASYRMLSPDAARLFRLLGLHPGETASAPLAASMAGVPLERVRPLLGELVRVGLVTERLEDRYEWVRPARVYARERGRAAERDAGNTGPHGLGANSPEACDTTASTARTASPVPAALGQTSGSAARQDMHRLLDHVLHTAHGAIRVLSPNSTALTLPAPASGVAAGRHEGVPQALAWIGAERATLARMVRTAAQDGFDRHAWQLAWALERLLEQWELPHDDFGCRRAALDSALRLDDPVALAHSHRALGRSEGRLHRPHEAHGHLRRALDLFDEVNDPAGLARTHGELGRLHERQGHHVHALHHRQEALERYREAGDRVGQSGALRELGRTHDLLGRPRQALARTRQAHEPLRGLAEPHAQAAVWCALARCHDRLGNHRRSLAEYQRALELYRAAGDPHLEARVLVRLGDAHRDAGDAAAARNAWQRALAVRDGMHHAVAGVSLSADPIRDRLRTLAAPTRGSSASRADPRPALRVLPGTRA
ncbi:BTAD domain-containing putative transcriptional regulator [Streptomyces sp. NPDC050535]|uniref:AfsR/SARP family transcriptional regulator n=1 Tax=Streptomyces sp. NPDC050535 TaxID=3365626 RepID=UPI003791CE45